MAKRKRRPQNSRQPYKGNKTLLRVLRKGLLVTPRDLRSFKPDTKDYIIAMAHLRGYPDAPGVERYARYLAGEGNDPAITEQEVQRRLEDPVRLTWLSSKLLDCQEQLAGIFWSHVYQRAIRGNDQAAKLWAQRFDREFRPTSVQRRESITGHVDLSIVDDPTRQAMLTRELRRFVGAPEPVDIIDVPVEKHEEGPTAGPVDAEAGADSSAT